jgi:hypothetical protein
METTDQNHRQNTDPGPMIGPLPARKARHPNSLANLKQNRKDKVPLEATSSDQIDLLGDMRHVYCRPKEEDRTLGQAKCRDWYKRDAKGFLRWMAELEKVRPDETRKQEPPVTDPGTERAEALIARLLDEWELEVAKQDAAFDAKFAAQPGAELLGASLQKKLQSALEREKMWRERAQELEQQNIGQKPPA